VNVSVGLNQPCFRIPFAGFTIAMAVSCPCLIAQEAKPATSENAPFTLRVSSREVILDVVVTDRRANLHNDLTREDFHITEDALHRESTVSSRLPTKYEPGASGFGPATTLKPV
jgi:hypothetical protein